MAFKGPFQPKAFYGSVYTASVSSVLIIKSNRHRKFPVCKRLAAASLAVFEAGLDGALNALVWWQGPCPRQREGSLPAQPML